MVSSSTAKIWLLKLPLFVELKSPKNWIEKASLKSILRLMKKAKPWPLMLPKEERMPNTKEREKDCTMPSGDRQKRSGDG